VLQRSELARSLSLSLSLLLSPCIELARQTSVRSFLMSVPGDPWCKLNPAEKVAGYFLVAPLARRPMQSFINGARVDPRALTSNVCWHVRLKRFGSFKPGRAVELLPESQSRIVRKARASFISDIIADERYSRPSILKADPPRVNTRQTRVSKRSGNPLETSSTRISGLLPKFQSRARCRDQRRGAFTFRGLERHSWTTGPREWRRGVLQKGRFILGASSLSLSLSLARARARVREAPLRALLSSRTSQDLIYSSEGTNSPAPLPPPRAGR
jgi:hypothetical protein